jgi:hypothetical protein
MMDRTIERTAQLGTMSCDEKRIKYTVTSMEYLLDVPLPRDPGLAFNFSCFMREGSIMLLV